jgi:hypothetical protein
LLLVLSAAPYDAWANLPVGINLLSCSQEYLTGTCATPQATIPLGQFITYAGRDAIFPGGSSVQTPVTISVFSLPDKFPLDSYQFGILPQVTLPRSVVFVTPAADGFENHGSVVPTAVSLFSAPGLGDHRLTLYESTFGHPLSIIVIIGRSFAYQATVFIVALLPLLLGVVVVHASARQAAMKKTSSPVLNPGVIAGLIAAMLAILPLRVLVPANLNIEGLTTLDYILVFDVLFIAVFVFFQYARFVTKS